MKKIGKTFGSLIIWASVYVSTLAFILCGGYFWLKSDDEYLKNETKKGLIVALTFIAINMLRTLVYNCLTMAKVDYYKVHSFFGYLITIAEIITIIVFAAIAVFGGKNNAQVKAADEENKTEETNNTTEA